MSSWRPTDLLPGVYLFLLACFLARALRRWYDPLPGRVLAVFAAVLLALFGEVLLAGRILLPLDSLHYVVPLQHLAPADCPGNLLQSDLVQQITPTLLAVRRACRAGEWPLLDPTVASGMPLLADPQSQFLEPLVLLGAPFSATAAAGVIAALRVLVALVFTYLFLVRQGLGRGPGLLGSLAYGLSGFLLLWLGWPLANAAALLPLVLYALARCDGVSRRRDFLLLGIAFWALLAGGQPEVIVYVLVLSGAFLLARLRRRPPGRRLRLLVPSAAAGLLAAAAVAPTLLPAARYLPQTERSQAIQEVRENASWAALRQDVTTSEGRTRWATRALQRVVPAAAPNAWGNNRYGAYWGSTAINEDAGAFVGGTALLLALLSLASHRRFPEERLMRWGAWGGLLAVAQPPALSPLLLRVPGVGSTAIHANQRVAFVVAFCLAYLAACGAERWTRGETGHGSSAGIWGTATLLAGLVAWAYLAHPSPKDPGTLAGFRHAWLAGQLAVLAATAALLSLPRLRGHRSLPILLAALTTAELLAAHGPANPPMPRRLAFPVTPPLAFLRDHLGEGDRMAALGAALPPNLGSAYDLPDIRVYNPMAPYRYEQTLTPLFGASPYGPILQRPRNSLYDFLGVRWLLTAPDQELPRGIRPVFRHPDAWVWERPHPLPRLFLPPPSGASRLEVTRVEPARVHARATLAERRLVVASLYQDGGWRLLVDGEPRETVLANGPFVAAWLSPASSGSALDLDLIYRPPGFLAGCLLGALALALGFFWWVPPPILLRNGRREGDHGPREDRGEEVKEQAGEVREDVEAGFQHRGEVDPEIEGELCPCDHGEPAGAPAERQEGEEGDGPG